MVGAPDVGRQVAAAVRGKELQAGMPVEDAREDQV